VAGLLVLVALGLGALAATGLRTPLLVVLVVVAGLITAAAVVLPARGAPGRAAAPPADWVDARQRLDRLREEYAGYECDPVRVLRLPALADVGVPSTARFVDALAEAQARQTDEHPAEPLATRFAAAVGHAEQAWRAARDAAERIRLGALGPAERAGVERVVKLLSTARGTDSEPERVLAYARARAELRRLDRSGAVHVPPAALAAMDDGARGALPPAASR
jgi:hypothetical protein